MDKKAELNIPQDKLRIALVATIVLFAFVFILVILAIIFSPGEIQKFVSNPIEALGGTKGETLKAEIGNVTLSCLDSDGGIEFKNAGFVINASGNRFEDNCTSSNGLKEYYCKNENVEFTSTGCADSCLGGACIDYKLNCTDSDGGINLNKSGSISGVQIELNRLSFAVDSCLASPINASKVSSGGFINEYFCSGKYINSSIYGCSSGCLNGACNGSASLLNCNDCLAQNKNYSCFSGSSVSCSLTFDATKCFDCRENKCGNGVCDYEESFLTCNKDCNLLSCGNGRCDNPFENEGNCPIDCKWHCGNGVCDDGETLSSCAVDCGANKTGCGNGVCEPPVETLTNCAKDCNNLCSGGGNSVGLTTNNAITGNAVSSSNDYCGDERCSAETCENIYNCPNDCKGSVCGNKICEFGETYSSCPGDCKLNTCGNGVCDYGLESVNTCPNDCIVFCGNGVCEISSGENSQNCQADCLGGICNIDNDCFVGMQCVNHKCVQSSCTSDANCHSGEKCINGVCLSECNTNSDCGAGKQCKEGFCNIIGTLTVSQPNGGETLIKGQTYDIKWSTSIGINRVSLYSLSNTGVQKTIVSGTGASAGKYSWTIPIGTASGQYKIKIANSANANEQDSSNDWFNIGAPASALPRLNSISPVNGKPGDLVTLFGEGFDSSANRVIFKILDSPFSFYNSKVGIEYLIGSPIASSDGRTLQFSIPSTLNQLDSSSSITLVPGTYQIIVSNSSSGEIRSNPLNFLANDYLNWPSGITITSPKSGDIWKVGEQKTITWNPVSGEGLSLPRVSLYVHSKKYKSSTDNLASIEYIKKINLSVSQPRGSLEWNILDFGDGDFVTSIYSSIEQLDNLPWIPLDGKLDTYIQIYGTEINKNIVYKDDSENFTLDTNVLGSCNECPRTGYDICDGTSSKKSCNMDGECLKWSTTSCPSGQTCSNGVCGTTITSGCTSGQKRCSGNGYQTCVVSNSVGIWGTTTACPSGQTCSNGVCGVGAGGACSKYPGQWYQISPPGSIGCGEFCAGKGLQSSGDFENKFTLKNFSVVWDSNIRSESQGVTNLCHTSDYDLGVVGGASRLGSINPNADLSKYSDVSIYSRGFLPGYGDSVVEVKPSWFWCINYGAIVSAAVDKCYCRDTSKDVNCPSGLFCSGTTSGVCTKPVCGNGVCEEGETASSCGDPKLPAGCEKTYCLDGTSTLCKKWSGQICTKATFYRGNCEVDCNPEWWPAGMDVASQPCNLYSLV